MKNLAHSIRKLQQTARLTTKQSLLTTLLVLSAFVFFQNASAQTLTIEKAFASGCYYYSGASKTTINVQVGWTGANSSDVVVVTLDGTTTRNINVQHMYDPGTGSAVAGPIVTPQVVAFEINADGLSHTITAVMSGAHSATAVPATVTAPSACVPMACSGTNLGGQVFYDNNADGTHQAGESKGIPGVTVTAFDKNGTTYTATSDGLGAYAFSAANGNAIPANAYPVRVEFTNFPALVSSNSGPSLNGNKSSVRFVGSPSCNVDCGGVNPLNYSQSNPYVFSNLYTNNDPLGGGSAGTTNALIMHPYQNNTDQSYTTIARSSQIGSVWAKSWNKYEKKLFVAAFLKRHCGFGPLGIGGLYQVNMANPASPVFSNLIDLTTLGIDFGQSNFPNTNAGRGMGADKLTPNTDAAAFAWVGKAGIGNMDFSDDGNFLYLMNLYDKKIYKIDFTNYFNSNTLPTAADVSTITIPAPTCVNGSYRPFALKINEGKLYTGMVCDGSTGSKSNMVAYVKALDLTTNTWSDVFDFPLTYPKGYPDQGDGSKTGWYNWSDNMSTVWNGSGNILHPTPILSDIEFDIDGTMVLALMDRTSHQMGNYNYDNAALNGGGFTAAGGDVLRAFYSNGVYILENAAKAGPAVGYAPTNNQGPGFGEFYNDNINGGVTYHTEMVTGGLTLVPGSGEVMVGMVDPSFYKGGPLWANGPRRLSNSTGLATGAMAYYSDNGIASFGKANGMGDMEAAPDNLIYIELGNYVWKDQDKDGVQDPSETGISGVTMKMYTTAGVLVGTSTTDANGNYYFSTLNGLTINENTTYTIVAGSGQYNSTDSTFLINGIKYRITRTNTGQGANPDLNDNDFIYTTLSTAVGAMPANLPIFTVTTGNAGYVNHAIDLGLKALPGLGDTAWFDTNRNGIQDAGEPPVQNLKVYLLDGSGVKKDSTTTNSAGYYQFINLEPFTNYAVKFTSPGSNYLATLDNIGSNDSTDSDIDSATYATQNVSMDYNEFNPTLDAGFITKGSLGNRVWIDTNKNGLQDEPASSGVNGIKVYLYKDNGSGFVLVDSTTTANNGSSQPGYYNFVIGANGDYKVLFPETTGSNTGLTIQTATPGVDNNSDADVNTFYSPVVTMNIYGSGLQVNNPTIDAGYYNYGSLGNYVWIDTNKNGLQDEPASNGVNGVTVYLYKDNGSSYVLIDSTVTANNGGNPGYYNFPIGTDGNYKVGFPLSTGNNALTTQTATAGVNGNSDANTTTGLSPVVVMNIGAGGISKDNPTIDAGYYPFGSLGNYVWTDTNQDGIQNEPSTNGINGVTVYLYKDNGSSYVLVDSTVTANNGGNPGYYNFVITTDGNYKVLFPVSVGGKPMTTQTATAATDGNSDANTSTGFSPVIVMNIGAGGVSKDNPTIDAGYYPLGSLGNYVWTDTNHDGLQNEPASNGINGVTVYLYKDNGSSYVKVDSTITADDGSSNPGYYNFVITTNGNYKVLFPITLPGMSMTTQTATAATDGNSDANNSTGFSPVIVMNIGAGGVSKDNPTIDAGYYPLGSLGNYVWVDTNQDGLQNEPASNGINGVKVYLYKDNGSSYVKVDSTITANDGSGNPGYYNFVINSDGNYKVKFPSTLPGQVLTTQTATAGTDGNSDADASTGFSPVIVMTLAAGGVSQNNPTIDAGYFYKGSIGNYVWVDTNQDGLQNEPASNGINGVTVYLYKDNGSSYVKVDSTITANDGSGNPGYYNFVINTDGNYKVQFPATLPGQVLTTQTATAGTDGNSDANSSTGLSPVIVMTLASGGVSQNNPTIDAGYYNLGSLGNYVWFDTNHNGLQDEPASNGINGVKVYLYKDNGSTYVKVDSTITANDLGGNPGYYNFVINTNGNYKVQFPASIGSKDITTQTATAGTDGNSDAAPITGFSPVVVMNLPLGGVNQNNPTIDAGYYCNPATPTVTGTTPICPGTTSTLTSSAAVSYQWYLNNTLIIGAIGQSYTTSQTGNYTVVVVDASGCTSPASLPYTVGSLPKPSPQYTVNDTLQCLGSNRFYFSNHTSGTNTYVWSFGDNTSSALTDPIKTYAASGTYHVKLIAQNTSGCRDSITTTVIVTPGPVANFTITKLDCEGNYALTNTSTNADYYEWNIKTSGNKTYTYYCTSSNPSLNQHFDPGTYTISLMARADGECTDTIVKTLTVDPTPVAIFSKVVDQCGLTAQFNNFSYFAGTYAWNFGDPASGAANTSTQKNVTHVFSAPGTYNVRLISSNAANCADTQTMSVVINPSLGVHPTAAFTSAVNVGSCVTKVQFTNTSTNAAAVAWIFPDGTFSNELNPRKSFPLAGDYTIKLVAISSTLCRDTVSHTIHIAADSYGPVATFTVPDSVQCLVGNSFNFVNNSAFYGNSWNNHYYWDFGDGTHDYNNTFAFNKHYNAAGTYLVRLVAAGAVGTCQDTAYNLVVVKPSAHSDYSVTTNCGMNAVITNNTTNSIGQIWWFGDAAIHRNDSAIIHHTYMKADYFIIHQVAVAANGCADSSNEGVWATKTVAPVAMFTYDTLKCSGAIRFNNLSTGATGYRWTFGDGSVDSLYNQTHSYSTSGSYNVTLVAFNGPGCSSTYTLNVKAPYGNGQPIPKAVFDYDIAACTNTISVTSHSVNAGGLRWLFDNQAVAWGSTASFTNPSLGFHKVQLVASYGGCTDTSDAEIEIMDKPKPEFQFQTSACSGTTVFVNNSRYGTAYKWFFDDAASGMNDTANTGNAAHTFTGTGTYNVKLVVANNAGCKDSITKMVTVALTHNPATAKFTWDNTLCNCPCSNKIDFINMTPGAGNSYLWNFGDGNTSTQLNPHKGFAKPGYYNVTLTTTDSLGCENSTSKQVFVPSTASGSVASFYTDYPLQCITRNNFNFYNNSSYLGAGYNKKYYWSFGDGTVDSSNTFVYNKRFPGPGTYTVMLVAAGNNGCMDTMTMQVTVEAQPCFGVVLMAINRNPFVGNPTYASPANATGIAEVKHVDRHMELYPNPNGGSFTLQANNLEMGNIHVMVVDILGQTVFQKQLSYNPEGQYDLMDLDLANGKYYLVMTHNGEVFDKKPFVVIK